MKIEDIKSGVVVRVKDIEWYNANKNEEGLVFNISKNNYFSTEMVPTLGKTYIVHNKYKNAIILTDNSEELLPYVYYPEWLTDSEFEKEKPEEKNPNIAYYKVTLDQAKEFWNSDNSILQDIAMSCFSMEQLAEV